MGWEWVLLLLTLDVWETGEGDAVVVWRARHFLPPDKVYFRCSSSLWNERLKLEAKKELATRATLSLFAVP